MLKRCLVLVTGASGFVGGNLVRQLVSLGYRVRYLARRGRHAIAASDFTDVERVEGDVTQLDSLHAACVGVDIVFHAAAFVSFAEHHRIDMQRVNVEGTAHLLTAARAAGVKRFVLVSTVDTIGLRDDNQPADETTRYNFDALNNPYPDTKKASEELVLAAAREGFDTVVANPGFMFGAYDTKPSSSRMVLAVMRGQGLLTASGGNTFVDVEDVCRGIVLVAERGRTGERYILAGHNMSYRDTFALIARLTDSFAPLAVAPRALTLFAGWLIETVAGWMRRDPILSRGEAIFGGMDHYFDSTKAMRELGYTISPIEPAIVRAAEWFRAHGYLASRRSVSKTPRSALPSAR